MVDVQMIQISEYSGVYQTPVYQEPQVVMDTGIHNSVYVETAAPPVVIPPCQGVAVVTTPSPLFQQPMKSIPARTRCQFCQQEIVTVTKAVNGTLVWIIFAVLLLCFLWPLCLIPFCVKSCKDIQHSCPNCNNVLNIYKRM